MRFSVHTAAWASNIDAFDILAVGENLATLPLTLRENNLALLLNWRAGCPRVHLLQTA
jgi:hypothetical protein